MSPFAQLFTVNAKYKAIIAAEVKNIIACFFNRERRVYIHKKVTAVANIAQFRVTKATLISKINAINFHRFADFNIARLMYVSNGNPKGMDFIIAPPVISRS